MSGLLSLLQEYSKKYKIYLNLKRVHIDYEMLLDVEERNIKKCKSEIDNEKNHLLEEEKVAILNKQKEAYSSYASIIKEEQQKVLNMNTILNCIEKEVKPKLLASELIIEDSFRVSDEDLEKIGLSQKEIKNSLNLLSVLEKIDAKCYLSNDLVDIIVNAIIYKIGYEHLKLELERESLSLSSMEINFFEDREVLNTYFPNKIIDKYLEGGNVSKKELIDCLKNNKGNKKLSANFGFIPKSFTESISTIKDIGTFLLGVVYMLGIALRYVAWPTPIWWVNVIYLLLLVIFRRPLLNFFGSIIGAIFGFVGKVLLIGLGIFIIIMGIKYLIAFLYMKKKRNLICFVPLFMKAELNEIKKKIKSEFCDSLEYFSCRIDEHREKISSIYNEMEDTDNYYKTQLSVLSLNSIQSLIYNSKSISDLEKKIAKSERSIEKLKKQEKDYQNSYKYLKDKKSEVLSNGLSIAETKGSLSSNLYLIYDRDEIPYIRNIQHNLKPIVFLYESTFDVNDEERVNQLNSFIELIISGFYRMGGIKGIEMSIVDCTLGAKHFKSSSYSKIVQVYDKQNMLSCLLDKIELNEKKVLSEGTDIKSVNAKKYECNENIIPYHIVNFCMLGKDNKNNLTLNLLSSEWEKNMHGNDKIGFLPIYYMDKAVWYNEDYSNSMVNKLRDLVNKDNVFEVNLENLEIN